ncbi:NYN domain-containing protein [Candidatus Woesearchaeota archaeon]|nr:NYN domain-containing protein [Candidatus Woesearchaeota archaeon]
MNNQQHKDQRVGVFVDVQNLYYSAKHLYNAKVNFKEILKTSVSGRKLIRAFCYVVKADEPGEEGFRDALGATGFEVKAKDLQVFIGGSKKGDWDVGIAMDIMRMAHKLDVIVLVSGDGDFVDLLEHAKALGCRVECLGFGRTSSSKLKEAADLFTDMDQDKKYLLKSYGSRPSSSNRSRPKRKSSGSSSRRSRRRK